ncbi:MAG: hypothetical protein EA385_13420 [Salinarimonadaceae bacterium]|nr:MAG: hypothetical protein EA385_13420 [Salinarimonadaceae bacterium]
MNSETQASPPGEDGRSPEVGLALADAERRLREARDRRAAYAGDSDHVRRKLDAALRSAEYDVAILRYAAQEE